MDGLSREKESHLFTDSGNNQYWNLYKFGVFINLPGNLCPKGWFRSRRNAAIAAAANGSGMQARAT